MKICVKKCMALLTLILPGVFSLYPDSAAAIMGRIDAKQKVETSRTLMVMRIYPNGDDSDIREFRVENLGRGEDESSMVFAAPRSIAGLRVLESGDQIRVYFPSTGRIRRITGQQKSGSVGGIGGDFSYEDMGGGSYRNDYRLSMEGEDESRWIIRGVPQDPESSYTFVRFFVEKGSERIGRVEYFTEEEGHKKTLIQKDFRETGGIEIPRFLEMTNHSDHQKTEVVIETARYNIPLAEKYFNPNRFYR